MTLRDTLAAIFLMSVLLPGCRTASRESSVKISGWELRKNLAAKFVLDSIELCDLWLVDGKPHKEHEWVEVGSQHFVMLGDLRVFKTWDTQCDLMVMVLHRQSKKAKRRVLREARAFLQSGFVIGTYSHHPAAKAVSIDGIPYAPGEALEFIRKLRPSQLAFINITDIPANPIIYGPLARGGLIEIKLRP